MDRTILPAPYAIAARSALPVILSVPHSGRDYPQWLLDLSVHGRASLEPLEDPLVDRLIWRAVGHGLGAVIARAPRGGIDCNRAPDEIDPAVVDGAHIGPLTAKARGGLGIVPGRIPQHGALWRRTLSHEELQTRIAVAHAPFHALVEEMLSAAVLAQGAALLLDCHSMPPRRSTGPDIVLGTRHGRSAAPWIVRRAYDLCQRLGFSVALNDPYAGGYIVERHGRPDAGIHAIQIEIDRSLYLDPTLRQASDGFDRVARLIERLAIDLANRLPIVQIAAE